jgi:hypothetical protein
MESRTREASAPLRQAIRPAHIGILHLRRHLPVIARRPVGALVGIVRVFSVIRCGMALADTIAGEARTDR